MVTPHYWASSSLFDSLAAFDSLLDRQCQVKLAEGTSINAIINNLMDLIAGLGGERLVRGDLRKEFQQAVGLADLAAKTHAVISNPELRSFCAHFKLLLEPGGLVQNTRTCTNEDATNKIFELLIALSLLQVGTNVDLEDPHKSAGGSNPDVIADVHGARWSFACKVLNTKNLKTYYDRVEGGLLQVQRASAPRGFVVVNLKNVLDYDALWPPAPETGEPVAGGAWESLEVLGANVEHQVEQFLAAFEEAFGGDDHLKELFHSDAPKAVPLVLNYVNAVAPCRINGRPTLTNLRMLVPLAFGEHVDPSAMAVYHAVDKAVATP